MNVRHRQDKSPSARARSQSPPASPAWALSIENLSVQYGDRLGLRDVSVRLPAGAFTAILGPSGSGKSTLLRALLVEVPWTSGSVAVESLPVNLWPTKKWDCSVLSCPGRSAASCQAADCPLAQPSLSQSLGFLGLAHLEGRAPASLTEADQRRVDLAATIAPFLAPGCTQAKHLWLDDPLSGLDTLHRHRLLGWLRDTAPLRQTTLLTTTEYALAGPYAGHIVLLAAGALVDEGPASAVLNPRNLTRTFGLSPTRPPACTDVALPKRSEA